MSRTRLRLKNRLYERELERLQVQLVEMQRWIIDSGTRVLVIFEGRDAAGKGGAIKRIAQYLNPRSVRVVALPQPSERERGQWYFQRYVQAAADAGEIVLMDRSWYNRAGVEKVMGYCSDDEYERFLQQVPDLERMLVDDGILLIKYWCSVSDKEQQRRFKSRLNDPMRRWKISKTDLQSIIRWEDYSRAKDAMFDATDTARTVVHDRQRRQAGGTPECAQPLAVTGALRAEQAREGRDPETSARQRLRSATGGCATHGARSRGKHRIACATRADHVLPAAVAAEICPAKNLVSACWPCCRAVRP